MENLNEFMLVFRLCPSKTKPTDEEQVKMHSEWTAFIGNIAGQGKLVSTYRLGFEGKLIEAGTEPKPMEANKPFVSGNMVLKAFTLEEATNLAKKCPILNMGGTVEVRQTLPMD